MTRPGRLIQQSDQGFAVHSSRWRTQRGLKLEAWKPERGVHGRSIVVTLCIHSHHAVAFTGAGKTTRTR